jgi:hypothetical protein
MAGYCGDQNESAGYLQGGEFINYYKLQIS